MSDEIKTELIILYSNLKIKQASGEISQYNIEKETQKLKESNIETILSYLKESISILTSKNSNGQTEEIIEKESQTKYEKYLRKLEQDIRNHIKIEYELKLHNEFLQSKIEHLENKIRVGRKNLLTEKDFFLTEYEDTINTQYSPDKKENEILILRAENTNLKSSIEKLEKAEKNLKDINDKYLNEIKNLKDENEKIKNNLSDKRKICNCEEFTKKYQKLYEDYLQLSSQNDIYNKMFSNLNRKTSPSLRDKLGLHKSQVLSDEHRSYRNTNSINDIRESKYFLGKFKSNTNSDTNTKSLRNDEMTLINLKKFNTMVKKHHSIDLNMQKINSNPINKNFEKNNLSNLNNLFSSSHNGGFFNQSQNFNKDMSIKVKLSNSNKKLQDVMRSSQNFLENRNLNVSPLRNFQTSFIHNMSTGFNLNSNGLLTSIKFNEEIKPKNEISQKLDKISSTLNLKSISNFKEV